MNKIEIGNSRGFESRSKPEFFFSFFFQVIFPVVLRLHSHLSFFHYLLLLDTYYHDIHILEPSITSTEHKGPTEPKPFSYDFDSSVGRALHRYRKGRGFESRSKPEFFSGHFSSSIMAAFASFILSKIKILNIRLAKKLNETN